MIQEEARKLEAWRKVFFSGLPWWKVDLKKKCPKRPGGDWSQFAFLHSATDEELRHKGAAKLRLLWVTSGAGEMRPLPPPLLQLCKSLLPWRRAASWKYCESNTSEGWLRRTKGESLESLYRIVGLPFGQPSSRRRLRKALSLSRLQRLKP